MTAARMVELELEAIPRALRAEPRWVLWKTEERDGKPSKVPYRAHEPTRRAKSDDSTTWASFDTAVKALENSDVDGLGFVLGDPWAGVDLDGCIGAEVPVEVEQLIRTVGGYAEFSPSGTGVHIIVRGKLPKGPRKLAPLSWAEAAELYDSARFFTVSGRAWATGDLQADQSSQLARVHAELDLERFKAKAKDEARQLAAGDISAYPSQSEADLALCSHLFHYTGGDRERADRLFRASGLYREKWDERHSEDGRTYGELTLHKAASGSLAGTALGKNGSHQDGTARFFNDQGTFVPKRLADELLCENHVCYTARDFWVYWSGVYRQGGTEHLSREAQRKLGEETRQNRVNEVIFYIATERATKLPDRPHGRYINVQNGRLDWMTGELHDHDPNVFEIAQLPVEYDPDASCPEFDNYLITTLDESLHSLVEEILGYTILPYTGFEKAVMLTGSGDNGKSVFLHTVTALLGNENVANQSLQNLEHNRFAPAELVGKLANVFADIPHERLKRSSMFKTFVSGDRITVERKNEHPFELRPFATLLFSANELPPSEDRSPAYFKRWLLIPFERQFPVGDPNRDPGLKDKLTRPDELSGILNRAISGLHRLFEQGHFTEPQAVKDALVEYQRTADTVRAFVEDHCVLEAGKWAPKKTLYASYRAWCDEHGHNPASETTFSTRLKQIANVTTRQKRRGNQRFRAWIGVGLSDDAPNPERNLTNEYDN